jgi:hypothetical protein
VKPKDKFALARIAGSVFLTYPVLLLGNWAWQTWPANADWFSYATHQYFCLLAGQMALGNLINAIHALVNLGDLY